MKLRTIMAILFASLIPWFTVGCIVIAGCSWNGGPVDWTGAQTERLSIPSTGLSELDAVTHNGSVTYEGTTDSSTEPYVEVTKKTGGLTLDDAGEAMAALEVFVEPGGDGTQRIGHRWRTPKRRHWSAQVSFDIHAPANVRLEAETHNGAINVDGAAADVRTLTHNGEIEINASGGRLRAETHNGSIAVRYSGPELQLETHNGRVMANLGGCGAVRGHLTTHNGRVEVIVGKETSTQINASTHNGRVKCDVPMEQSQSSRGYLSGKIGAGEGGLQITTHNGGIEIRNAG